MADVYKLTAPLTAEQKQIAADYKKQIQADPTAVALSAGQGALAGASLGPAGAVVGGMIGAITGIAQSDIAYDAMLADAKEARKTQRAAEKAAVATAIDTKAADQLSAGQAQLSSSRASPTGPGETASVGGSKPAQSYLGTRYPTPYDAFAAQTFR